MTTIRLGEAMNPPEVSDTIEVSRAFLADLIAGINPNVSVAAPAVTVTPSFTVEREDDVGEIAAIEANTEVLKTISNQLGSLLLLLAQPTTTTVERGSDDLITKVVETRG